MRRFLSNMALLSALTLAACSGTHTTTPSTTVASTTTSGSNRSTTNSVPATTSSTVATQPSTTASAISVANCRAPNMSVRRGRGGAATGHSSAAFEFTNNGERCVLDGYPMLLGLNDADQWEPVAALQSRDSFIPPPPPLNGPLERGEIAVVLLQMTDRGNYPNRECPTAPKIPPTYRALRFVLPADTTPLDIVGMFGGGCSLTVSPFGKPN